MAFFSIARATVGIFVLACACTWLIWEAAAAKFKGSQSADTVGEKVDAKLQDLRQLIKEKARSVVLIHTFSASNSTNEKDFLIYNSSIKKRLKAHYYKHGVISGVIISEDGVVCTTANGIMNSDKIIVSINSEFRPDMGDDKMVLTEDDYEAEVIKSIPALNVAFLKIKPHVGKSESAKKFEFVALGDDDSLANEAEVVQRDAAVVIGKSRGETYVTGSHPGNSKNCFKMATSPVAEIGYRKERGIPILILENPVGGTCVIPENEGGAILWRKSGKLLGIAVVNYDDFAVPSSTGIPISVIKQGARMAVPHLLIHDAEVSLGITVKDVKKLPVEAKTLKPIGNGEKGCDVGVEVTGTEMDSAGANAGVQVGDIILKFNDEPIVDRDTFVNLESHSIGMQNIELLILRGKKMINIEVNR